MFIIIFIVVITEHVNRNRNKELYKVSRPPPPPVVLVPPAQLPGHLLRPLPALVGDVLRGLPQPGGEGGHQAGAQHLEAGREEVEEGGGQTEEEQHHLGYQNIIININNININKKDNYNENFAVVCLKKGGGRVRNDSKFWSLKYLCSNFW